MQRQFCRAKIAQAVVTKSILHYEGSCGIDTAVLETVGVLPYEWILIANVNTGARFETYVIPEPPGSGTINIYGAAAHHAKAGDEIIIMAFAFLDDAEARAFKGPKVVKLKPGNQLG
jgi:aspartate 1-decarboxylase